MNWDGTVSQGGLKASMLWYVKLPGANLDLESKLASHSAVRPLPSWSEEMKILPLLMGEVPSSVPTLSVLLLWAGGAPAIYRNSEFDDD